jgi:hypothetical protein
MSETCESESVNRSHHPSANPDMSQSSSKCVRFSAHEQGNLETHIVCPGQACETAIKDNGLCLIINPIAPPEGTTTTFLVEDVEAPTHKQLEAVMYGIPPGKMAYITDDVLINQILKDTCVRRTSRVNSAESPVSSCEQFRLVCVSKDFMSCNVKDGMDMVFALVGDKMQGNERSEIYNLRCLLYVKTCGSSKNQKDLKQGRTTEGIAQRYIRIVKLPTATCKICYTKIPQAPGVSPPQAYIPSQAMDQPATAWLKMLNGLHISNANISMADSRNERNLESYRKQNSGKGLSYCVTSSHKDNDNTSDMTMQFSRNNHKHVVTVDTCTLDALIAKISAKHLTMVTKSGSHSPIAEGKYEIPMKNSSFSMSITIPHTTRVKCALTEKLDTGHLAYVASSDVNFCNNMVYADMRAKGIENVFGVQRIALRIGNKLQDNLTPVLIARRLGVENNGNNKLLSLMSSSDLMTDLETIVLCHDIKDPKLRTIATSTKKRLFRSIDVVRQAVSKQLVAKQDKVFQKCSAFTNTRVTASISSERPRWQDHHPALAASDFLLRQKMTSARGVAILNIRNATMAKLEAEHQEQCQTPSKSSMVKLEAEHRQAVETCVLFSSSDVPRLIVRKQAPDTKQTQRYTTSRPLSWTEEESQTKSKFAYEYCKFSKAVKFVQGSDTVALFEAIQSPPKNMYTNAVSKTPGSLIQELLNLSNTSDSVFTRAMAHRVLIGAIDTCPLINTQQTPQIHNTCWLNHYRAEFLDDYISKNVNLTGIQLDQLYVDYSIFGQCLKDQALGSKIPTDMFALLVQQGIPFPNT